MKLIWNQYLSEALHRFASSITVYFRLNTVD